MKLNINKMQSGGSINNPAAYQFLDYVPIAGSQSPAQAQTQTPTKTSKSDSGILSKDMIDNLMGKGLTSDVTAFVGMVDKMYSNPLVNSPFGSTINSNMLQRQQLSLLAKINQIQNNKELFTKAVDSARSRGGLNELAVTPFGRVLALDEKGQIKQMSAEELYKNRGNVTPLTNAQVAEARMNNPSMAFETSTFNIIENAVGQREIDEYIGKIINDVNKMSAENNTFKSVNELTEVKNGLKGLQEGIYKETNKTESNVNQMNAAISYLYKTLPDNYRNYLRIKSASSGIDPRKGVIQLIQEYAGSKTYTSTLRDIDFDATLNKSKLEKDSLNNSIQNTPLVSLFNNTAIQKQIVFNPGSQFQMTVGGSHLEAIPSNTGNLLPSVMSVGKMLTDSNIGGVVDSNHIYMGDQKIDPIDLNKVLYNGGGVTKVNIPIDDNGNPDLQLLTRYEEAKDLIDKGNITNPQEIRRIYESKSLFDYVDANGNINPSKFKTYLVLNGAASEEGGVLSDTATTSGFVKHIKGVIENKDSRNSFAKEYLQTLTKEGTSYKPGDDIYMGPVFMEVTGNALVAAQMSGSNLKIKASDPYTETAETNTVSQYVPSSSNNI